MQIPIHDANFPKNVHGHLNFVVVLNIVEYLV
jgi:hypothetical protein